MKRQKAGPGVGQPSRARSPRDGLGTAPMKSQHASSVAKNSCESGGHQPAYHDEAWETLVSLPNSPLAPCQGSDTLLLSLRCQQDKRALPG